MCASFAPLGGAVTESRHVPCSQDAYIPEGLGHAPLRLCPDTHECTSRIRAVGGAVREDPGLGGGSQRPGGRPRPGFGEEQEASRAIPGCGDAEAKRSRWDCPWAQGAGGPSV